MPGLILTTWLDRDGAPLAVGDHVSAQSVDEGAPGWVHRGVVVGFGRTRVKVRWDECVYAAAAMDHHAVVTQRLDTVTVQGRKRQATALRRLPTEESPTTV